MEISFEKIFFLGLLVIALIAGAEFTVRNHYYVDHSGGTCVMDDPLFSSVNQINCQYEAKIFEGPEMVSYKINSCGFRDERSCESYSTAKIRIYGVGDSYTFGHAVPWRDTYVSTAETWLSEASKTNLVYINGGVNGWDLVRYEKSLDNALKFAPTAVTMAISPTNLVAVNRNVASEVPAAGMFDSLVETSSLLKLFSHELLKSPSVSRWGLVSNINADSYLRRKYSENWEQRMASARVLLEASRDKLKAAKVPLVVILIPNRVDLSLISDTTVVPEFDSQVFSKKMISMLTDLEIPYIDFMAWLKNRKERLSYFYPLDKHLTPAGQKALGEYVAQQLFFQQNGLFLPEPPPAPPVVSPSPSPTPKEKEKSK